MPTLSDWYIQQSLSVHRLKHEPDVTILIWLGGKRDELILSRRLLLTIQKERQLCEPHDVRLPPIIALCDDFVRTEAHSVMDL